MQKKSAFCLLVIAAVLSLSAGCTPEDHHPKSEVLLEGSYRLAGMDNMEFTFRKDSTLTVLQTGIYELTEQNGEPVVRICLDDIDRELPEDYSYTDYRIQKEKGYTTLTYTSEEFSLDESPMILLPIRGKDGLHRGSAFDGSYQIGENGDSYQYIFKKDGSMIMQIKEYYYADGQHMILSDHSGNTQYLYEKTEQGITLMNQESEPVLVLTE